MKPYLLKKFLQIGTDSPIVTSKVLKEAQQMQRHPICAKRIFRYETDLVRQLLELLPKFLSLRATNWKTAVEVGVGAVISDIVIVLWEKDIEFPKQALSVRDSVILATLRRRGPTRIDLLESKCGLRKGELREASLKRLIDNRLVERKKGGVIGITTQWAQNFHIIAIEAKLYDWRRAIMQARSYTSYADEIYVAMPVDRISEDKFLKPFLEEKVGLIAVSNDSLRECHSSIQYNSHGWRREFALSRIMM